MENFDITNVDRIGYLRSQIADLQAELKKREALLKEHGAGTYEGQLFRVTVTEVNGSRVDWKAVAAKLNPSRQLVRAYTKATHSVRLTVSARKKAAA